MSQSEVAQFRQQQAREEESAQLALNGIAIVGGHDHIIRRMELGAATLFQLFKEGRSEEAYSLWNNGILE